MTRNQASRPGPQRQTKNFTEALLLPQFNLSLQKLSGKKGSISESAQARTALEEQYDFTIVEEAPVKILIFPDGLIKYILLIERQEKEELEARPAVAHPEMEGLMRVAQAGLTRTQIRIMNRRRWIL